MMIVVFYSCTKYNYIDGGIANGVHDCTMWEYFHTDRYGCLTNGCDIRNI